MQARLACDVCISACDQRVIRLGGRGIRGVCGMGEEAIGVEMSVRRVCKELAVVRHSAHSS